MTRVHHDRAIQQAKDGTLILGSMADRVTNICECTVFIETGKLAVQFD
jgi:hypothetical protein